MTPRNCSTWSILLVLLAVMTTAESALAGIVPSTGPQNVQNTSSPLTDASLVVQSWEKDGLLGAEVQGELESPFTDVRETLPQPESWCAFLPLVFNIKSCTYTDRDGHTELTLYVGRKFYQSPKETFPLHYEFKVQDQSKDRFGILLLAPEGPYGTRDYRIEVEVTKNERGSASLRMRSSFRPSLRSRLATTAYLATAGRDKIGFSLQGDQDSEATYVDGTCGIIERNAMRYFMALKAHLNTCNLAENERLEARLHAWYDMTARYPQQLYEMDREEYLDSKRREWVQQKLLQKGQTPAASALPQQG